jgi:hypothetical protein
MDRSTGADPERSALIERLGGVERRFVDLASAPAPGGLTEAEPDTGERWEAGQVWAHLAEFPAYWLDQVERVVARHRAGAAEPIAFGRTKSDPDRIAAIERDRTVPAVALLKRTREGIDRARHVIESLAVEEWTVRAAHPVRGEMTVGAVLERFVVDHLEEHAAQLDALGDHAATG